MKNIELNLIIENNEEKITTNIFGTKDKNVIIYDDNGIETKVKILNKCIKITRKNIEYSIELDFKEKRKTTCTYLIFKENINIKLIVNTTKIEIEEKQINIEYELYNKNDKIGNYKYNINFREG